MKVLLIPLLAGSLATGQAFAPSPAAQSAQSPELAEASRLSTSFVQLYNAGKFEEALPLAERALALREKSLGPSAAPVAAALANLGAVQRALRKNDRARESYERAVSIYEATLGPDAPATVNTRNTLAWHYYWTKNYEKAEAEFRRALEARSRSHGAAHPLTADTLSGLAAVHLAVGDPPRRDEAFLRLIEGVEQMHGPVPKGFNRLFLAYRCTIPRPDSATEQQSDVLRRIHELWKKKAAEEGAPTEGEVLNGKAISKPAPSYPREAMRQRVAGTVVVHITVDEKGQVVEAEAVCGPPLLYEASERAARMARFTPTLLSGKPVKVTGTITYNYHLY